MPVRTIAYLVNQHLIVCKEYVTGRDLPMRPHPADA